MAGYEKVAIVKCDTYEYETARKALSKSLSLIDGLSFVKEGMKVGIKTNLVTGMDPEKAVTTHPVLLKALCMLLTERGASVVVGDSPGGLYTASFVRSAYKAAGLNNLEDIPGVSLNSNFDIKEAVYQDAISLKTFSYTAWLDDVDVIINFSKLKTHAMMGMSCAVKNMFGCIPGATKPEYHLRFPNEEAFAGVMLDLNEYFKPVLYVVDAIDGMEGNGPTAGDKRHIGAVLSSKRPYALDLVCADLIGMGIFEVPTLLLAKEKGLGPADISEVDIAGKDALSDLRIADYKRATIHQNITFEGGGFGNKFKSAVAKLACSTKPLVNKKECIGCRKCFETCPAKAISMVDNGSTSKVGSVADNGGASSNPRKASQIPDIDRTKCIKCFCCQEFCPVGAMKVHYNPIGKVINMIQGR